MTDDPADRTLYLGGRLLNTDGATAILVVAGGVTWVGTDADAARHARLATTVVHLEGGLVTPAFVDAHVHLSQTGEALRGVDLSRAGSLHEALSLVETGARRSRGRPVYAHGWDESTWPERRPFTAGELDRAAYGGVVYASRVDGHSAVVSSALAAAAGLRGEGGGMPGGLVQTDAHHRARDAFGATVTPAQRRDDIREALQVAATRGIAIVHENGGPLVSSTEDLADARAVASEPGLPQVVPYWAELVEAPHQAREVAATHGAQGLAGDLNVDGSIGSRTASLRADYADAPGERGNTYLSVEQVSAHVAACTLAGLQAGFHVIGDGGVDTVLAGFETAAHGIGLGTVRAARHRLEHVEMISPEGVRRLARLGVVASVQPAFDAAWGGGHGMYAKRLGTDRVGGMNPFRTMLDAGVPLALGSDSPVTSLAPWEAVRACVHHHDPGQRLTADEALHAHTAGGLVAARSPQAGGLAAGAVASFVVWDGWRDWVDEEGARLIAPASAPPPTARLVVHDGQVLLTSLPASRHTQLSVPRK